MLACSYIHSDSPPLYCVPGIPHKGWNHIGVIDLREDEGLAHEQYEDCQFCHQEKIRFVHLLEHSLYYNAEKIVRVGCVCAVNLTGDSITPKLRQRERMRVSLRRSQFPQRCWRVTRYGGKTLSLDGHRVTVSEKNGCFRVWIDGVPGKIEFKDEELAMLRAFDYIQKKQQLKK